MAGDLSPLFSWRSAICDSGLPPTVRHVALTLSLHMNERGGSCFPKVATLVDETGLSERSVRNALAALGTGGWLIKEARHRRDGGQSSNIYTARIPRDPGADAAPTPPAPAAPPPVHDGYLPPGTRDAPQEVVSSEDVPPTPTIRAVPTASPAEAMGEDDVIEHAIAARISAATVAGGITKPSAFARSVRNELDTPANRERVIRWLTDYPTAPLSALAGCLADGNSAGLRYYARADRDADLYAEHDPGNPSPLQKRSLRLIASAGGADTEAPGD